MRTEATQVREKDRGPGAAVGGRDQASFLVAESTTLLTEHPLSGASPVLKRRLFTLSLLLTTVIPMVFFIAVGFYGTPNRGLQATKATLLFVGGFHVAATLCLYIDHEFLRLIRQNPLRYVHVPLAVSIGSGVLFALGGLVTQAYFLLVFWGLAGLSLWPPKYRRLFLRFNGPRMAG